MRYTLFLVVVVVSGACPAPTGIQRPYPEPAVADLTARLIKARDEAVSFRADTTMDYWIGGQRAKGEVLLMGAVGSKLRFAALSPAGGSTMVEMACDGASFAYVDYQNNCTLSGPCDRRSIAQFFRIELEPDDFVRLAFGTPPIIATAGKSKYAGGNEVLELAGEQGAETLALNLEGGRLDVIEASLVGPDGQTQWSVRNGEFVELHGRRVPRRTRFRSPSQQQDLLVDWGDTRNRAVNIEIPQDRFQLVVPKGLPTCSSDR